MDSEHNNGQVSFSTITTIYDKDFFYTVEIIFRGYDE